MVSITTACFFAIIGSMAVIAYRGVRASLYKETSDDSTPFLVFDAAGIMLLVIMAIVNFF
jgi:hypothetical protein